MIIMMRIIAIINNYDNNTATNCYKHCPFISCRDTNYFMNRRIRLQHSHLLSKPSMSSFGYTSIWGKGSSHAMRCRVRAGN